jgi:hypothetical protein
VGKRRLVGWLLLLGAAAALAMWLARPSTITRQQFGRLRVGITRAEVHAILGPPGEYRSAESAYDNSPAQPCDRFGKLSADWGGGTENWWTDTAVVFMAFDRDGKAYWGHFAPTKRSRDDLRYNLTWRVMHRWGKWLL